MAKEYVGDSVYADFDGFQICFTTENGFGASNTIYMELAVFMNAIRFAERCYNIKFKVEHAEVKSEKDDEL